MRWVQRSLGDVCNVVPGFAFKSKELGELGIPIIKIGNIKEDLSVDVDETQCIPEGLLAEKHSKYFLGFNDILIAMTGATAGKVGRIRQDRPLMLNQRVAKLEAKHIHPDFLWHLISSEKYQNIFFNLAGGAAQPNMSGGQIEAVSISVPDHQTQKRIADVLSAYDDLIENNRRRIALLEESARLLYREWFVHLRFPGHEHVKIIDGIPNGWERLPLGEMLTLQRGFDLPVSKRKEGSFPIYASTGVNGYHVESKVSGPGVVTGRSGSLGKVMFISGDFWPLNTTLWIKEFKKVGPHFSMHLLSDMRLEQYNGGAAVPTLNRNDVHRVEVVYPSPLLLQLFEEQVSELTKQIDILRTMIDKTSNARDLLLPRLMNGVIEV